MTNQNNTHDAIQEITRIAKLKEALWSKHKKEYELTHPRPSNINRWLFACLVLGTFAAIIMSGMLTVPTFRLALEQSEANISTQNTGGVAGFIMTDIFAFALTLFIVRSRYRPLALKGEFDASVLNNWATKALGFSFFVQVTSNMFFVFQGYEVIPLDSFVWRGFSFVVASSLALASPIMALAGSTMLALIPLQNIVERQAYEDSMLNSFRRKGYDKKLGLVDSLSHVLQTPQTNRLSIPMQTDRQTMQTGTGLQTGQTDRKSKSMIALEFLQDNPDKAALSSRKLAAHMIEVGIVPKIGNDATAKAIRQFEEMQREQVN